MVDDCADGHLFLDPCGALDGSRHWSLSLQPRMSRGHGVTTPFTVSLLENVGLCENSRDVVSEKELGNRAARL